MYACMYMYTCIHTFNQMAVMVCLSAVMLVVLYTLVSLKQNWIYTAIEVSE